MSVEPASCSSDHHPAAEVPQHSDDVIEKLTKCVENLSHDVNELKTTVNTHGSKRGRDTDQGSDTATQSSPERLQRYLEVFSQLKMGLVACMACSDSSRNSRLMMKGVTARHRGGASFRRIISWQDLKTLLKNSSSDTAVWQSACIPFDRQHSEVKKILTSRTWSLSHLKLAEAPDEVRDLTKETLHIGLKMVEFQNQWHTSVRDALMVSVAPSSTDEQRTRIIKAWTSCIQMHVESSFAEASQDKPASSSSDQTAGTQEHFPGCLGTCEDTWPVCVWFMVIAQQKTYNAGTASSSGSKAAGKYDDKYSNWESWESRNWW